MTTAVIEKADLESAMSAAGSGGVRPRWTRRMLRVMGAQVFWHMAYQIRIGDDDERGALAAVGGFVWDGDAGAYEAWVMVLPGGSSHIAKILKAGRGLIDQRVAEGQRVFARVRPDYQAGLRLAKLAGFHRVGEMSDGTIVHAYMQRPEKGSKND